MTQEGLSVLNSSVIIFFSDWYLVDSVLDLLVQGFFYLQDRGGEEIVRTGAEELHKSLFIFYEEVATAFFSQSRLTYYFSALFLQHFYIYIIFDVCIFDYGFFIKVIITSNMALFVENENAFVFAFLKLHEDLVATRHVSRHLFGVSVHAQKV